MILSLNSFPYQKNSDNYSEALNEAIILVVIYHILVVSDLVSVFEFEAKTINGYSMIFVIILSVLFTLCIIIYKSVIEPCSKKIKKYLNRKEIKLNEETASKERTSFINKIS